MKSLSTLDTLFASMETSRWPLHGGGVMILDPSTATDGLTFDGVVEHLRRALPDMPPLRRRLVQVPLGISDPYWVEDPEFLLERHLHRIGLPAPGDDQALQELVSQLGDPPLDFSRPLWDLWYIEGLESGRVAIYIKMHHACVDGMGGLAMMDALFSSAADQKPTVSVDDWTPDRIPSAAEMVVRALPATAARPFRAGSVMLNMSAAAVRSAIAGSREPEARPDAPRGVPLFSGPSVSISQATPGQVRRSMGWSGVALTDIAAIREAHGGTLNDVALAMCGGALRQYLVARGQLPEDSLTAINPVNMRTESPSGEPRNQFSLLLTSLHTEIEDPIERLAAISARMTRTKSTLRRSRRNPVEDVFSILTPGVVSGAAALAASPLLPDLKAPANLCVTNVAFAPTPVFFAGAEVEQFYVMMMQSMGLGLVIALMSYAGTLQVAITANKDAVDDPQEIAVGCVAEIARMLDQRP